MLFRSIYILLNVYVLVYECVCVCVCVYAYATAGRVLGSVVGFLCVHAYVMLTLISVCNVRELLTHCLAFVHSCYLVVWKQSLKFTLTFL